MYYVCHTPVCTCAPGTGRSKCACNRPQQFYGPYPSWQAASVAAASANGTLAASPNNFAAAHAKMGGHFVAYYPTIGYHLHAHGQQVTCPWVAGALPATALPVNP